MMGFDDELRDQLHATGDELHIDTPQIDAVLARGDQRQRRTRIGTAAASLVLLAGGIFGIVALTDDGGDEATTFVVQPEASATAQTPEEAVLLTGEPIVIDSPVAQGSRWVVPWGDSFLSLDYLTGEAALAENLPAMQELRDVFTPEVVALFENDLPANVEDATATLTDAGLIDNVNKTFAENPGLYELVTGAVGPGQFKGRVLDENQTWSEVDVATPADVGDNLQIVESNGSHLAIVDSPAYGERQPELTISTTDDLQNWTPSVIPVAVSTDSPYLNQYSNVSEIALGHDGWVAVVEKGTDINVEALFNDIADPVSSLSGSEVNESGITYYFDGNNGEAAREAFRSWDELPVDYADIASVRILYSGTYDGVVTVGAETDIGEIGATDDGFVARSFNGQKNLYFSSDGSSFVPIEGPPIDSTRPVNFGSLGDATLVFMADGSVFRGDASAQNWTPVKLPASTQTIDVYGPFTGAAITETASDTEDANTQRAVIEEIQLVPDGYHILISNDSIVVSDAESGDEIVTVSAANLDGLAAKENGDIDILDPTTTDVLVTISAIDIEGMDLEALGVETAEVPPIQDFILQYQLLATADGVSWLVSELDYEYACCSITNGDKVLVQVNEDQPTLYALYNLDSFDIQTNATTTTSSTTTATEVTETTTPVDTTTAVDTTTPTGTIEDGPGAGASSPEEVMELLWDAMERKNVADVLDLVDPEIGADAYGSELHGCLSENFNMIAPGDELEWETDSVLLENGTTFVEGRLEITSDPIYDGSAFAGSAFAAEVIERNGQWYIVRILRGEGSSDNNCVDEA